MSTTMKKTTERLSWNTLLIMYSEYLATNAEDAKSKLFAYLDESVQHDADELHDGNTVIVLKAVKNNCVDDKKSRFKHATYITLAEKKLALLDAMTEYINKRLPVTSSSPTELPKVSNSKPRWQLTIEEMDAIDAHDYKALDSIYQNMASKKAKQPEAIIAFFTNGASTLSSVELQEVIAAKQSTDYTKYVNTPMYPALMALQNFNKNFKHISELRTACKQYDKTPVPVVSDNLSAKLEAGKTSFTKSEVEELRKLLNK